jgi:hypothetical protein
MVAAGEERIAVSADDVRDLESPPSHADQLGVSDLSRGLWTPFKARVETWV